MITLYGPRNAPFTEKVARGLALKKLGFELVEPRSAEDYRRWSPSTGMLPVIDLDGERIADSTAILLRVDEIFPEPPLLSHQELVAQNQLRFVRWVDEAFLWYWMRWMRRAGGLPGEPPFGGESLAEAASRGSDGEPPRPTGVSLRSWVASRVRRPTDPEKRSELDQLVHELGNRIEDLARLLAPRPFFYADRIGIADLAAYAMLRSLAADSIPGIRPHLDRQPALVDFMARVERETGGSARPCRDPPSAGPRP